jgi:SAM-dependent methyltransferase
MNDMVKRDRFIAHDAYEKLADSYAELVDTKPHNAYLERPATLSLLPDVWGKRALDVGCGTGRYTEWLVENGAEVIGFDASPRMLAHAKERVGERAELRLHDLNEPLDFVEDDSIDLVLAPLVLDYIEDWRPVLVEFRRVLRDDGILVFSVGHPTIDFILKEGEKCYFEVERFDMWWTGFGERVLMPSYRRPLQNITDALQEADFDLDRLVEARPTPEYLDSDPEGYEKVSRRPSFLCIRAKPRD